MSFKRIFFLCLLLHFSSVAFGDAQVDSLLHVLSETIANRESLIRQKTDKIASLRSLLKSESSLTEQFNIYSNLHTEYRTFQYDSAFSNALRLQEIARRIGDSDKETVAKLKLSHTLLSSGMYNEALDTLNTIQSASLPKSIKTEYYALKSRAYYDLSGYTGDIFYSSRYVKAGEAYVDSALSLLDRSSLQFYALRGMKREISFQTEKARKDFETILEKFEPSLNQFAMAANSLGNIYYKRGEEDRGMSMMARAALADVRACVKEGVALMTLAEFLYRRGDEERAYDYIKVALEDAEFYDAKQRRIQVATILPVIEGQRLATVENQKGRLMVYAISVSVLSLLVVVFVFIIFRQLRQLRQAKRKVTVSFDSLQQANQKLTQMNDKLQEINNELIEANKIKEEYIGYSFNMYTEYIDKIEKLKRSVDKKLMARKYADLGHVLDSVNLKKERESLYESFDKVFLKLFPDFVPEFNSFFKEEDHYILKDNQCLNIELRIFALIRIGINDHEQIARLLEYSVRTVYNYKSKVKNRSLLSNEEFEERVMEIKAF